MNSKSFLIIFTFVFFFLCSESVFAEKRMHPTKYKIEYDADFEGYIGKNIYEEKNRIIYIVSTVESGPYCGLQMFSNYKQGKTKNLVKPSADSSFVTDGKIIYVYDYSSHWIYHNLYEELLVEW